MRAALYARVSSEEQVEGYSIDAQLRACRNYAREKGWVIVNEYVDEGKSARSEDTAKRPKFKEMLRPPVMLSISEMGHFLNRTLWHNQAALTSSLSRWFS